MPRKKPKAPTAPRILLSRSRLVKPHPSTMDVVEAWQIALRVTLENGYHLVETKQKVEASIDLLVGRLHRMFPCQEMTIADALEAARVRLCDAYHFRTNRR